MKLETEWCYGIVAGIINTVSVVLMCILLTASLKTDTSFYGLLSVCAVTYAGTLGLLLHFWADKFNYLED